MGFLWNLFIFRFRHDNMIVYRTVGADFYFLFFRDNDDSPLSELLESLRVRGWRLK